MSKAKSYVQHKSDVARSGIPVSFRYQPLKSMPDLLFQQQGNIEISRSDLEPRTSLSALAEIVDLQHRKTQRSCELPELKCEYLTVEIPNSPTHQIRVYGCSLAVGVRYSMRAQLSLSILREVANLLQHSIQKDEQYRFDWILTQASALVGNFVSDSKTRHKQHTCRGLIKALQRLEVLSRQLKIECSQSNKGAE
ncbi:hypothetical protein F3I35_08695 [Pantoea sp. Bo_7]|uniref:hypothetical protein n=1 Tax=Pantoea TaxID=53335 RepID=UPI0012318954|nr:MULTISPECIES: hypothetical protein [Pantoea]KAA6048157.1 hypothetical protein F3I35_08695 [Pantoea sp. Bo_7]KAA6093402.1 hypothetical protein F3I22_08700 [Pantoea sp. Bo_10]MDJ0025119.1 hypothetical protein [Pantoea eucrina]